MKSSLTGEKIGGKIRQKELDTRGSGEIGITSYFTTANISSMRLPNNCDLDTEQPDIILITGDAYVDHPSFGTAVIGRVLEQQGYRVGVIAMPDWHDPASVTRLGAPRLFFGVTSGNVDSLLSRYTAFKRYRSDDPYVPGGKAGRKPERAVLTYCNLIKAAYKNVPVVIGGVEASMRRIAHYDFWSNSVRRSIIEDARADVLVYGMGERAIVTLAERLDRGASLEGIAGTVMLTRQKPDGAHLLPAEEEVMASKQAFLELYREFYRQQHRILAQPTGKRWLAHYPPSVMSSEELDAIYELPFTRQPHPSYTQEIPALTMIRHSITAHRGCVSGCSFCSLGLHQGKRIVSRSPRSILREAGRIAEMPDFKGHITDIGGPSANMYGFDCTRDWRCRRESCLFPALCPNLRLTTRTWLTLLQRAAKIPGVSKVTVGSGIRYDVLMQDPAHRKILRDLLAHHVSGHLKIAPEHTSPKVLRAMRKTPLASLSRFLQHFRGLTGKKGKAQYPLPYVMSCHPGSTLKDMQRMKDEIVSLFHYVPHQVQAFIPLPMTLSSVIYYTGVDPLTGEHFKVVQDMNERRRQHQVFFETGTSRTSRRKKRR